MRVRVVDQQYLLAVPNDDGGYPDPDPAAGPSFAVEVHPDVLFVQGLDESADLGVDLNVTLDSRAPHDLHEWDAHWPGHVHGEWTVSGPVFATTVQGDPGPKVLDQAGHYGFLYLARKEDPEDLEPGDSAEVHHVFFWPIMTS